MTREEAIAVLRREIEPSVYEDEKSIAEALDMAIEALSAKSQGEDERRYRMKPTEKQIEYAKYLAKRMNTKLPSEFTKEAYSDFISKWKPIVKKEDDSMNEPNEWQLRYF